MKFNLKREWYAREAEKEEHLEVTAGFCDISAFREEIDSQKQSAVPPATSSIKNHDRKLASLAVKGMP